MAGKLFLDLRKLVHMWGPVRQHKMKGAPMPPHPALGQAKPDPRLHSYSIFQKTVVILLPSRLTTALAVFTKPLTVPLEMIVK